jgi:cation diffusion facilitator CzcD-associated flavoprotein CzcO
MGRHIAVIGAGAAGLCAAKHLLSRGHRVTVFEHGSHVGGLWVYENDNGMSPAYQSLHLNSENKVTAYEDFPFPPGSPLYPDHVQVTAYLRAYAEHFAVMPHIRFNSPVTTVEPVDHAGQRTWRVEVSGQAAETFDAVVVASGHQNVPRHPPFAGEFTGQYLHAHDYRVPEPFKGKKVLVVGIGNSACDIASDIAPHTSDAVVAARSPVLLMPRMFLGVPTSRVLAKLEKPWMPWTWRRLIRTTVSRLAFGTMEQWGFRTPKTRTHPAGHHLLMGHFVWGRLRAKPGIAKVQGRQVIFDDGSSETFDTLIAATGYLVELPFLPATCSPMEGHWINLYQRIVHPQQPGLYFVGFFNVSGGGNIRMMDDQSRWITDLVSGSATPPSPQAMRDDILADRALVQSRYPDSPRYGLELDPLDYRQSLAKAMRR